MPLAGVLLYLHAKANIQKRKYYECSDCGNVLSAISLNRHKNTHIRRKKLECNQGGNIFHYYYSMNMHLRILTGEKPFNGEKAHHLSLEHMRGFLLEKSVMNALRMKSLCR
jgi:uncharacterized CHY-type Zn-finger protein